MNNGPVRSLSPLRIDWLLAPAGDGGLLLPLIDAPGRIGLSSCPGRCEVSGDVEEDIATILSLGIGTVVSLVSDAEMAMYGVLGLRSALRMSGLRSVQFVIEDKQAPADLQATRLLCASLLRWLGEGENILLHCIGGWGRSGTIAACLLAHQGYDAESAVELVRQARSPYCVETARQFDFVRTYARSLIDPRQGAQRYYCIVPRAQLGQRLRGESAARRLVAVSAEELLSAAALGQAMRARLVDAAPESPAGLAILSGERGLAESDAGSLPVDRALVHDGRRWRAIPFAELLLATGTATQ
jgi:protein-tyrosine phosphatase